LEFKLNKIDTDIRKKMQENRKDDKVHSGKAISVKRDLKDDRDKNHNKYEHNQKEEKKFLTIDGIKYEEEIVSIQVEKLEKMDEENSKGRILDAKK